MAFDRERIEKAVREILIAIGEDPDREGLKDTPKRVAKMYEEILAGYNDSAENHLVLFTEKYDEMIIVRDIPIYSLCEHHMLPFFGKAHVAYIPGEDKVTGLSKLARIVDVYAKRLQLQERMTEQIADAIMEKLGAKGVMVVVEAQHLCMIMRGVKKPGSYTVTSAVKGAMRKEPTRMEALFLIKGR
ncbi:GTP cyclohydrolase 1 [Desulfurobacterium thermolithotrophum DSM 11699]|uniref:GTP cyclohydrolase 1 n=1 Tax=Desulfurobacterium thermolithotrophum (strain DSM 11699 / BSA) TaxID=868864 RepID=F0RZZ7_DESTD|nr:GTP cyclohydrolase I FolE [Desulfurobacterium thermolithotrophum]ADY73678.1 GTP cyclohydrolase 1 [Desulfurobacterium thermolithotrophum DSM 11699]